MVGAHFFTDIVGGIVIAYIGFKYTIILFEKFFKKINFLSLKNINTNYFFLTLIIFILISIFVAVGDSIDIYISSLFYLGQQQFVLQSEDTVTIIFRKIFIPAILICLLILPLILICFKKNKLYFYFKFSFREFFLIFVSVLMNLIIIVNVLLKNLWGRARPNEIEQLGGKEIFTPWYEISNACYSNCSFVSGDASVGFSIIILYLITKNILFFWSSLIMGLSIGLIRILEGGHFFSDVILSGLVIYLFSYAQFYFFKKYFKYDN